MIIAIGSNWMILADPGTISNKICTLRWWNLRSMCYSWISQLIETNHGKGQRQTTRCFCSSPRMSSCDLDCRIVGSVMKLSTGFQQMQGWMDSWTSVMFHHQFVQRFAMTFKLIIALIKSSNQSHCTCCWLYFTWRNIRQASMWLDFLTVAKMQPWHTPKGTLKQSKDHLSGTRIKWYDHIFGVNQPTKGQWPYLSSL